MKTKFILHGGATSRNNPHNDSFFSEFSKNLKDGDVVLFVGFARETISEQLRIYERDKKAILDHTDKNLFIENAELDTFTEQLKKADAVYVTGGVTKILKERIATCPDFADLIKGKVYAGSSAGTYLVSKYHVSGSEKGIHESLGIIVPICTIAHYGNSDFNGGKENIELFTSHCLEHELVVLPECEWKVFEI